MAKSLYESLASEGWVKPDPAYHAVVCPHRDINRCVQREINGIQVILYWSGV